MADIVEEFVDADAGDSEEQGGESMPMQEDPTRVAASVSRGGGEEEDGVSEYADAEEVALKPRRLIYPVV